MIVMLSILAQMEEEGGGLTIAGGVIMSLCIVLVLGLTAFCILRILREKKPAEHHHAPLDINTHDVE